MKAKTITSFFVAFFLALIFISDFHYKYLAYNKLDGIRLTLWVKIVTGGLLLFSFMFLSEHVVKKANLNLIFGLIICSVIGLTTARYETNFQEALYITIQYFFGIGVMLFFLESTNEIDIKYPLKVILFVLWINLILIFLGYYFEIKLFKTYNGARFGYNGLFKSTSTASYFYMLSLILFESLKTKSNWRYVIIANIIVSSLFIGSKSLYVFIAFYGLLYLGNKIYEMQKYFSQKKFFLIFTLVVLFIGYILFIPLISLNSSLNKVLIDNGVISAIFSYRDLHLKNVIANIQEHYNLLNYFFGGLGLVDRPTEFALVDIFLTFGLLGTVIFGFFLINNFPKINDYNTRILIFGVIAIIILRGNFFYFPSVIYISMVIFTIILKINFNNSKNP